MKTIVIKCSKYGCKNKEKDDYKTKEVLKSSQLVIILKYR